MKSKTVHFSEPREVLDIRQAADFLGISEDTLYNYASKKLVPALKMGNRWKFKRSRLNRWLDEQIDAEQKRLA